jgi:hypothetical protein
MKITNILFQSHTIPEAGDSRNLVISGESGSVFSLTLTRANGDYYNFETDAFAAAKERLSNVTLEGNSYSTIIVFPSAGASDTYTLNVWAESHYDTSFDTSISDSLLATKVLSQYVDTEITLTGISHASSGSYASTGSTTLSIPRSGSSGNGTARTAAFSLDMVINTGGFNILRAPVLTDMEAFKGSDIQVVPAVGTDPYTFDSVEGLAVGMTARGNRIAGTPTIKAIDTEAKTITFSTSQTLLAGDTIKFYGGGNTYIDSLYQTTLSVSDFTLKTLPFSTVTTSAVSANVSVPVASSAGIMIDTSTVGGIGIDPSVIDPTVTNVVGNTLTLSAAQTLEDGISLTITNGGRTATLAGTLTITKAGNSDFTLFINLDNLLSII